jgi:tetratricopeptide (TPR) repeat protein
METHTTWLNRWLPAIVICATFLAVSTAWAQEGGELPSGASIFRPKNPETKSKRRTNKGVPRPSPRPGRVSTNEPPSAEAEERIEDALTEGNEDRDARKYAEAETAYKTVLKLSPRDARAAYGLGNIYTDQQRWDDAEKAYRQSVNFGPANADAWIALSYVLEQPRSGGSNAGRLVDAEMAARRAIQLQSTSAVAHDRLGVALEERALLNGDTEAEYRRAIELDENFAVAYVHLARLLRKMNKAQEAEPFYKRAIDLAKDAPTLVLIADALQSEQRWADSEPVLKRALELDARNPNALLLKAKVLMVRKLYSEAEPLLKSVIEISPRSFTPYFFLGSAYLRMEKLEEGEDAFTRAAKFAAPGDRKQLGGAYGLGGIGDGYMKAGRKDDAVRVYRRALQLDPDNAEVQNKLADARPGQKP